MLSVSSQTRYALRALQYIADHHFEGNISIARIAKDESISPKYLENIFKLLKKGGLVRSARGPEGGYQLTRDAGEISLWDIVAASEGDIQTAECVGDDEYCDKSEDCAARSVWTDLQNHIESFLQQRTLKTNGRAGG